MKRILLTACTVAALASCTAPADKNCAQCNPFFTEYETPFGVPPFESIKTEHYKPAFMAGMEEQMAEIEDIVTNPDPATFENTVAALDQSGALLSKVSMVFYGLNSANTNDELQALSKELSPLLSKHSDDISLNPALFQRIKQVYENQDKEQLDKEQKKLLEEKVDINHYYLEEMDRLVKAGRKRK